MRDILVQRQCQWIFVRLLHISETEKLTMRIWLRLSLLGLHWLQFSAHGPRKGSGSHMHLKSVECEYKFSLVSFILIKKHVHLVPV